MDSKSSKSTSPKPGRLASFKSKRDLSLGSSSTTSAQAKTKFAPNLNVQRRKKSDNDTVNNNNNNNNSVGKGRRDGKSNHNNNESHGNKRAGGKNGRPELIRATSGAVFAEGLAASTAKSVRAGSSGDRQSDGQIDRPVLRKDVVMSEADRQKERERLKALLRDDFIDSDDMALREGPLPPVQLPMVQTGSKFEMVEDEEQEMDSKLKKKKKKKNVIDSDDEDEEEKSKESLLNSNSKMSIHESQSSNVDLSSIISVLNSSSGDHGSLMLTQLPDHLPVLMKTCKKEKTEQSEGVENSGDKKAGEEGSNKSDRKTKLSDLPDGCLGRLRIRRSGRAELVLGEQDKATMQVELGAKVGFLQDVVSIATNNDESNNDDSKSNVRVGDMTVLGHVNHRLIISPNFGQLLQDDQDEQS